MKNEPVARNQIRALTEFSVGTLDEREAMMVLEYAENPNEYAAGIRHKMPFVMTPQQARKLAERLLRAATSDSDTPEGSGGSPDSATS